MKDQKQILHLPQTRFPMKARLSDKEPQLIQFWQDHNIYQKLMQKNKDYPLFTLIDGPPYANGHLHIGHALNKILKDIIVKYANLSQKQCPFIPIWDCHGLPIEMVALKKIKKNQPIDHVHIRKICRETALHWVEVQKQQFERLGVLAPWNKPLLTLDPEYEAEEVRVLAKIAEKNLLYRGKKPVYWCWALQTAIASSEVEYRPHRSPSIYVKWTIPHPSVFQFKESKPCSIVIWTTTPWTLPANQAIGVKADCEYGLFDSGKEYLILAKARSEDVQKEIGLSLKCIDSCLGQQLEHQKVQHPFMDRLVPIILGDYISTQEGSGCVHIAPGHGLDDFISGQKYQLPVVVATNERGLLTSIVPEWEGQHIFKANPLIIDKLRQNKQLLAHKDISHNYPFNPRSQSPLIFRATPQWFIALDHASCSVRKKSLSAIQKQIQFSPPWGKKRLGSMIQNAPDWCLSRQRHWGVPIPVFHCKKCSYILVSPAIMRDIAQQMENSQQGIEYWFQHSAQQLLPRSTICPQCQAQDWEKSRDILDVWFDSGISHTVYQKKQGPQTFPADIYLEGSDQHRGWFQTSLISALCLYDKSPFKRLITHCFINDAQGHKMSKSRGNVFQLDQAIKERGAEILRLWASSEDYSQDLPISQEILDRLTESYRRFRNTIRFMLGNLFDFHPDQQVSFSNMQQIDQWILGRLSLLISQIKSHYDFFLFHKIYQDLNVFFSTELSSLYLDILKDRLYTGKKEGLKRRSAQTAIYHLLSHLLPAMSPITTFLSEEAYQNLPGHREESVLLTNFPAPPPEWVDQRRDEQFQKWLSIRQLAYLEMEAMRKKGEIGSSLETQVHISAPQPLCSQLKSSKEDMKEYLIVSQLHVQHGKILEVKVLPALGEKCLRCWHYSEELNPQKICPKCKDNLS